MNFTVLWLPRAEEDLATLWMNATVPSLVAAAANEIDRRLKDDPGQQGESRSNGRRILFVPPLGVIYRVRPADRVVLVVHVWQFKQRR